LADKAALRAAVQSCLAHLPGDLRFYTTAMYADDVSQLLADLHYPGAGVHRRLRPDRAAPEVGRHAESLP
jgi:hypothetical protein